MMMMNTPNEPHSTAGLPWWRTGAMWLVVGLPAAVIVGGCATFWIAMARPDVVVDPDYYARGLALAKSAEAADKAHLPAQMGRNHSMTPDKDVPALRK